VTEAITGLDLVELQLRVASGEPLGLVQEQVKFAGHAIEIRLCAEDAAHDFMPQSGTMARWRAADNIRVDHALRSGSEISPFYDSMIAKLIATGSSREEARSRLICGLEQMIAFGVTTNQSFLMACLRYPVFAKGAATTGFIGAHHDELVIGDVREEAPVEGVASNAALGALLLTVTHPQARQWRSGRTLAAAFPIPLRVESSGKAHEVELIRHREGGFSIVEDGHEYDFEIEQLTPESVRFRNGAVVESVEYFREVDRLYFLHRGATHTARDLTLAAPDAAVINGGDGKVRAAMNGRVVAVLVKQGDRVAVGQPVMTLEAMKMEHVHTAGIAGTVAAIDVVEGEQVAMGKVVIEIAA
jgi:geranyl-CoA carboxylase alpha subunit